MNTSVRLKSLQNIMGKNIAAFKAPLVKSLIFFFLKEDETIFYSNKLVKKLQPSCLCAQ